MAIDLFPSLKAIGKDRDVLWYDGLSEDDKKSAHPFVLARWLSGTNDEDQILRLNEMVNPYLFSLGSEKPLLFKLLAAACTGSTSRYHWIKPPGSGTTSNVLSLQVVSSYYEVSKREASQYLNVLSCEDVVEMAELMGWEKSEITALKKEFKNESGSVTGTVKKPKGKR